MKEAKETKEVKKTKQRPALEFEELSHTYTCNGKELISASTLLGLYKKEFNADETIQGFFDKADCLAKDLNGNEIYIGKKTEYIGMTREQIKQIWEINRISKSSYGTFIHARAEDYGEELKSSKKADVIKRPEMNQVKKFFKEYSPVENELQIYALTGKKGSKADIAGFGGIAGTIDLLVKDKEGCYWLMDYKTNVGKDLSTQERHREGMMLGVLDGVVDNKFWGYALQMSLYRYVLEKTTDIRIKGQCIVHLIADRETCCYEEMTQKGKRINYKQIPTPYMEKEVKDVLKDYFIKKA